MDAFMAMEKPPQHDYHVKNERFASFNCKHFIEILYM